MKEFFTRYINMTARTYQKQYLKIAINVSLQFLKKKKNKKRKTKKAREKDQKKKQSKKVVPICYMVRR